MQRENVYLVNLMKFLYNHHGNEYYIKNHNKWKNDYEKQGL